MLLHKEHNNEDGYASNEDGWITKLWGDDSGNFWTFVNDKRIQGAGDEVKKGDHMYASIFADQCSTTGIRPLIRAVYQFSPAESLL